MSETAKSKLDLMVAKSFALAPFFASETAERNAELNAAECLSRPLILESLPARIRLEPTNACNLSCSFCFRRYFRTDDSRILSGDDIDHLQGLLDQAKFVCLSQKGEPFMSRNIVDILDRLGRSGTIISLYSNGQLLSEKIAASLIDNQVNFMTLSISAFDEQYSAMHGGGSFERLTANLETLNRLKQERGTILPRLRLSYVFRTDNARYLSKALDVIKTYDFSQGLQVLAFYRFAESDIYLEPIYHWEECLPYIEAARQKAEAEGIPFDFSLEVESGMRRSLPEEYIPACPEPWESFNVTAGGDVVPCCVAGEVMGNIRDESPEKIWNNEKFQAFRRRMTTPPYNKDCLACWSCRFVSQKTVGEHASRSKKLYDGFYRHQGL